MTAIATGWLRGGVLALALALLTAAGSAAQQTGAITGVVRDAATNQPIQSAQIQIVGTERGTLTNVNGRYRVENVPVGSHQVRAVLIGYGEAQQGVTVQADQTAILNFQLATEAVALEQVVVTATGEQRKRQLANQVSNIDAAELTEFSPITKVTDLLTGRASGVSIMGSAGTTGAGQRIRIRGSSSISLQNDPVIYIDGIRVESGENSGSVGVGGQVPSRLSDINPENIESIEVIKGPSAATLYGTDAANGVIRITTKRGQLGSAQVQAWVEAGVLSDENSYPANYTGDCFAFQVGLGSCAGTNFDSWNPLEEEISAPFQTGNRQQYGMSVSGGSERLNYYVSGEWEEETGVLALPPFEEDRLRDQFAPAAFDDLPRSQFEPNFLERLNLQANFGGALSDELTFRVNTGYVSSDLNLPNNDNNVLGLLPSALLGTADGTEDGDYGYGFFLPSEVMVQDVTQEVERFTGSGQLDWQPLDWLSGRAILGLDVVNRTDIENIPRERLFFGSQRPLGFRQVNHARIFNYTIDVNSSARFRLNDDITSRTTVGVQYFRDLFTRSDAEGYDIVSGAESLAAAANTEANETTAESITLGAFVEQEFGFRDNLFVTAALRGDDNSAFGNDFDFILYPKFGASWVASEEAWFPQADWLSSFRVRTAWGRSGTQPGATDALRFFNAVAVTADGRDQTGVTFGELGNPDLEPEQSEEIEAGFDLGILDERVGFEFTYYDKKTTDLLIEQPLPPSGGVGDDRFVNLGEVSNKGFEVGINASPVRNERIQWDLSVLASTNDNELVELGNLPNGNPIPTIKQGVQWFEEGYALGGYWDKPVSFDDANGDGILTPDEVTVGDTEVFLDEALPTREISLSTSVTLWNRVRINGLLDHAGGHSLRNLTEAFRCGFAICEPLYNPNAPLDRQAAAIADVILPASQGSEAGFIEDASFWKLREVGVTVFVPEEWSQLFGADRASLTLTGRNLATWTDYTGVDPEINQFGQANFLARDFLTQPPVRYWTARVNLSF